MGLLEKFQDWKWRRQTVASNERAIVRLEGRAQGIREVMETYPESRWLKVQLDWAEEQIKRLERENADLT